MYSVYFLLSFNVKMGNSCCMSSNYGNLDTQDDLGEALIIDTVQILPGPTTQTGDHIFLNAAPEIDSLSEHSEINFSKELN